MKSILYNSDEPLLEKTIFIYFLNYNKKDIEKSVKNFIKIFRLSKYIYFNKYPSIDVFEDDISKIESIYKEYKVISVYAVKLFKEVSNKIDSFNEMEFISFMYHIVPRLKKYNIDKDEYSDEYKIKKRLIHILNKLNIKENIDDMFQKNVENGLYSLFNGPFESGIENIFVDSIPKNFTENDLYNNILKLYKEIKNDFF